MSRKRGESGEMRIEKQRGEREGEEDKILYLL
jgi:hypothetical protein